MNRRRGFHYDPDWSTDIPQKPVPWLFWTIMAIIVVVAGYISLSAARAEDKPIPGSGEEKYDIQSYYRQDYGGSCCGEADAYMADVWEVRTDADGNVDLWAQVTDTRDDKHFAVYDELGDVEHYRPHIPVGTWIRIPAKKLIQMPPQKPNYTGHGWIWVSANDTNSKNWPVFCYLMPGGA